MKQTAVIVAVALGVLVLAFSYKAYKAKTEADLAARRVMLQESEAEKLRQVQAKQEAQRLLALQAAQEAEQADRKLEALRKEELAAEDRRVAAEAESAQLKRELDDLRRQKDATMAMVQKSADQREVELATIAAANKAALDKLKIVEDAKVELASRQTSLDAALQKQIELEKQAQERAQRYQSMGRR